jgi:D-glycero-beta-D-manno-heptose 1-phosphate adenylyltransferase
MSNKVISMGELPARVEKIRAGGRKIVATNGCFDLVHPGHVRYLKAARALGDILVVGLNGNASVRDLKGEGRPLNDEKDRAEVLAALESVDLITIFPELRATRFLEAAAPDIYVKGGDYNSDALNADERAALEKVGAKIDIVPFEKGYSTTRIIGKLRNIAK